MTSVADNKVNVADATENQSAPVSKFAEQYQRLFLVWKNKAGVKTAAQLRQRLGITESQYIKASRGLEVPEHWLIKTANSLRIDVEYIRTGKANTGE